MSPGNGDFFATSGQHMHTRRRLCEYAGMRRCCRRTCYMWKSLQLTLTSSIASFTLTGMQMILIIEYSPGEKVVYKYKFRGRILCSGSLPKRGTLPELSGGEMSAPRRRRTRTVHRTRSPTLGPEPRDLFSRRCMTCTCGCASVSVPNGCPAESSIFHGLPGSMAQVPL